MRLQKKVYEWNRNGRLFLGENAQTGKPIALTKKTLSVSHVHIFGPTGSGKTEGIVQLTQPLFFDNTAGKVLVDNKPGGGDISDKALDFCYTRGLTDRVELIDFGNRSHITGYSPLVPDDRAAAFHAKAVRGGLRSGTGQTSFDDTRQLARFLFIAIYAARLLNWTLEGAWELLKPNSLKRKDIIPRLPDPFLRQEMFYIESLSKQQREGLLASAGALIEGFIADPYMRACLTHPYAIRIQKVLQEHKILVIKMGHGVSLTTDDTRQLSRIIVNDILASIAANRGQYGETYLIMDECQLALTPEIATIGLETGRSLGLRCFLAHQYLDQLRTEDPTGRLYAGVRSQCRVKLIFGGAHKADLEEMASERIGEIDIFRQKHVLTSLETEQRESTRMVRTRTRQGSESHGITVNESETVSKGTTETFGTNSSLTLGQSKQRSRTKNSGLTTGSSRARGRGSSRVASEAETTAASDSWAKGTGSVSMWSEGSGFTSGDSESLGESMPIFLDGTEGITTTFTGSGSNMTSSSMSSFGGATSHSNMKGGSRMQAKTRGNAAGNSESEMTGDSLARTSSEGEGETDGESKTETEGKNHSTSTSETRSVTRGRSPSYSQTHGWSESEAITPFMEVRQRRNISNIAYVTPEEQTLEQIKEMKNIPIAHATLIVPLKPAAVVKFPWVTRRHVPEAVRERGRARVYDRPYHAPFQEPEELPSGFDAGYIDVQSTMPLLDDDDL